MADSVDKVKTLRCHIKALERIDGKFMSAESDIKLDVSPRKLYFRNPEKKLEILYREGEHDNQALVKPNSLPTSIYLDPNGGLMRKNQHYTIQELGYGFISQTIKSIVVKEKGNIEKNLLYLGIVNKGGEPCHMIKYENKNFTYTDYTVGRNESVSTIAMTRYLSDYMIRYKNDLNSYYGSIKQGKVIKVPSTYCYKAIVFISEKSKLPVALNIYDEKDLWESYEYTRVVINKPFESTEFTRNYKDYHF